MKKFITFAVVIASSAYYACLPFVVAQAGGQPGGGDVSAAGSTIASTSDAILSVLSMRITAYASVPDETDNTPFITADGSHVADGIVASNILPFGTRIEIPALFGDKIFTVHDRMSTKIKNTIDIWMPSVKQAVIFGAEHATILVLGSGTSTAGSIAER